MAITLDQINAVINIPQADLTFVSAGIYSLDTNVFRQTLRNLEDTVENEIYPRTHNHFKPITVGGVDLARVVEITPHWTVTFEDGQYRVILEGSNNNILDVANVNQVSIAPTNSAGLTYSKQVEDAVFTDARVWIDANGGGVDSVVYPTGGSAQPTTSWNNAETIIANRSLAKRLHLKGDVSFGATDNIDNYDILGEDESQAKATLTSGVSTTGTVFSGCEVTGTASGEIVIKHGELDSLTNFEGHARFSKLLGTITLSNSETAEHEFRSCYSSVAGESTPIIDCNDLVDLDMQFRGYHGGLELRNISDAGSTVSIDLDSGHLILASTCTAGTIVVRGVGNVTDNSGVGCTVITTGQICKACVANEVFSYVMEDSETFLQSQRLQRASAAGKIVQLPDGSYLIKSKDGLADRIDGSLGSNNSRNIDATDSS